MEIGIILNADYLENLAKILEMKELSCQELRNIEGGVTFAYRIGQLFRGAFMSAGSVKGYFDFMMEAIINEQIANSK